MSSQAIIAIAIVGAIFLLTQKSAVRNVITGTGPSATGRGFNVSIPGYGGFSAGSGGFNLALDPRVFGQSGAPPVPGFPAPAGPDAMGGLPSPGGDPTQSIFAPPADATPDASLLANQGPADLGGAVDAAALDPTALVDSATVIDPSALADASLAGAIDSTGGVVSDALAASWF